MIEPNVMNKDMNVRAFATTLCFLLFALQPISYMINAGVGGILFIPMLISFSIACGIHSGKLFHNKRIFAAIFAGLISGFFSFGAIFADAAFDNLFDGRLDWWREKVAFTLLTYGCLTFVFSIIVSVIVSSRHSRKAAAQ